MHAAETQTPSISPLGTLNPEQRAAVESTDGPVLVLAGAGTGKTRVLTARIAHILMSKKAFPNQILAVTFTNKAAREMSDRVEKMVGGTQSMWLGTFHSICSKILRRHAELVGLTSSFTILDTDDQIRLIKTLMSEKNIDDKQLPAKLVLAVIQSWKDQGLNPDQVTNARDTEAAHGQGLSLYRAYQERLRQVNACDFGDLLLHVVTMFRTHQDLHKQYSERFRYILVDEYQDTNVVQYMFLRLLAMAHKNICVVGDDDQSIYSWRGAQIDNILRFEHDFPGAQTVRLERNYRSTQHILSAAGALIANNSGRLGKQLWTDVGDGEKVRLKSLWDDSEEARFVGDEIESQQRGKRPLREMAILVRAGFQTRSFEERFLSMGIPYRVIGGLRFYERLEIRDAVAYLRVIAQPDDDLAFERIINTPKRGIGQATVQQLHTTARNLNASLFKATEHLLASGGLKGKLASSLGKLLDDFARWKKLAAEKDCDVGVLTEQVIEESGYKNMWQQDKSPEAAGRLENLRELARAIGEFETLSAFLEHVSLVTDAQENESSDMVSIMTFHAAKGLEFEVVFLTGWEEGLFPHQRALDESGTKGLEEERRLAYVGITRARQLAFITYASNRRIYNQWQSSVPSRFIREIPTKHVEQLPGGAFGNHRYGKTDWAKETKAIMESAASNYQSPTTKFQTGARVFHQKFGYGVILDVHGDHLEINFEKSGEKRVLADFVTIPA